MDTETSTVESAPASPTVAALYLPLVKSGKAVTVYGASGSKYSFRADSQSARPAREYDSLDAFEREELDIRKNVKSPHVICSRVGSPDPAARAKESVLALIEARLRVPGPARVQALLEIAKIANRAAQDIFNPAPAESPIEEPAPEPELEQPKEKPEHPKPEASPETGKLYTQPELQEMPIDTLRALVTKQGGTTGSRAAMIAYVLGTQNLSAA